MKPHPRIRKAIKWGGAVVTVLLVVVWVWSGWWLLRSWSSSGHLWGVDGGFVIVSHTSGAVLTASDLGPQLRTFAWSIDVLPRWYVGPKGWTVQLPLWLLCVAALAPTFLAWRLDTLARRRAKLNLCPKCNYDRTGLVADAKCPECGSEGVSA